MVAVGGHLSVKINNRRFFCVMSSCAVVYSTCGTYPTSLPVLRQRHLIEFDIIIWADEYTPTVHTCWLGSSKQSWFRLGTFKYYSCGTIEYCHAIALSQCDGISYYILSLPQQEDMPPHCGLAQS